MNNVLPVSTGLTVTQSAAVSGTTYIVRVGERLSLRQTFSDPGFTRSPLAETFTFVADWGEAVDASRPVTTTSVTNGNVGVPTRGTITASHLYTTKGTYVVGFTVSDDDQIATAPIKTVTVIVTDLPVAVDDAASVGEDSAVPIAVLGNDTGDTIALVGVTTQPVTGTVAANTSTGVITYTATGRFNYLKAGATAVDRFTYTMRDRFNFTDVGEVVVTVTGVNDLPVLDLDSAASGITATVAFKEDAGSVLVAPRVQLTDPDDTQMQSATVQIQNLLEARRRAAAGQRAVQHYAAL